jgi:hypothetical protein
MGNHEASSFLKTSTDYSIVQQHHKLHTVYTVPIVPQCLSPRWNWDSPPPHPLSSKRVCPSPRNQRGHTRLRMRGLGSPYSDNLRKGLALCLLCEQHPPPPSPYHFVEVRNVLGCRSDVVGEGRSIWLERVDRHETLLSSVLAANLPDQDRLLLCSWIGKDNWS